VYKSDIMLNYLKSTNCFDELFFAFNFHVVNTTDRILNALDSALRRSSFVSEHFFIKDDNYNRNFRYNLTDANYTEVKH